MGLKEPGLRGSLRNVSVGIAAIPDAVVDDFERGNLDPYTLHDAGNYNPSVTDSSPVLEGDKSLQASGSDGVVSTLDSTSGLDNYPSVGDLFGFLTRFDNLDARSYQFFGVQDESTRLDGEYWIVHRADLSEMQLRKDGNTLDSVSVNYTVDQSYDTHVDWVSQDEILVKLYEGLTDELDSENEIATLTVTNISDGYTSGGIGWGFGSAGSTVDIRHDYCRILKSD